MTYCEDNFRAGVAEVRRVLGVDEATGQAVFLRLGEAEYRPGNWGEGVWVVGLEDGQEFVVPRALLVDGEAVDRKLMREFTRGVRVEGGVGIEVAVIDWPDPSVPETQWKRVGFVALRDGLKEATVRKHPKVRAARRAVLEDKRFFAVCRTCGERNPQGWMLSRVECQGCGAGRGIVY